MRLGLAALLALVLSFSARAGVVYNFVTETQTSTGYDVAGRIVLTNEAWLSGGASVSYTNSMTQGEACAFSVDGIESFYLGNASTGGLEGTTDWICSTGDTSSVDIFTAIFEFGVSGNWLDGSVSFFSWADEVYAAGDEIWSFSDIGSDDTGLYDGCAFYHSCGDVTGRWVLDAQSLRSLPEPAPSAMIGIGMILIAYRRRKLARA